MSTATRCLSTKQADIFVADHEHITAFSSFCLEALQALGQIRSCYISSSHTRLIRCLTHFSGSSQQAHFDINDIMALWHNGCA